MASVDSLLQANLDTHWYAVNQQNGLEIIEKDDRFTRVINTIFGFITGRDFYAHIRYENISKAAFLTIQHEQDLKTVDKYIQIIEKLKNKTGSTLPPNEMEKNIVDKYNHININPSEEIPLEGAAAAKTKKPLFQFNEIKRIENCVQQVLQGGKAANYYNSQDNHIVFSAEEFNGLIFKMRKNDKRQHECDFPMSDRLKNIKKAKSICKTHKLNLLSVPEAEVVKIHRSGRICDLLVEKKLDLYQQKDKPYSALSSELKDEITRQLAIFILNSGASDMEERNLPLVRPKKADSKKIKVGLIDLEEMNSIYTGLFGGVKRKGLIGLFDSKQKDIILKEIENTTGICMSSPSFEESYKLDFSNFPKSKSKLIEISNTLYKDIMLEKKLNPVLDRRKGTDEFFVDVNNEGPFQQANALNLDTDKKPWNFPPDQDQEYFDAQFIGIVSNEFIRHGWITGVSRRNGHGWWLKL